MGEGSIAMLERLMSFWKGKIFVLVLLGFAATDFMITTLTGPVDQVSAEDGWTGFRRRDPDQAAALFDHGGAIVVPVRMLPGDGAVVLDQRFHRLRQIDDLDVATELCPVAEEPVIEHTQPGSGVTADIQGLHCGFAGTDD